MVANYAINKDMFLISTNFEHKKIRTGTWIFPHYHKTINQIDHVMVSKEKMTLIHDVRSKRGYNSNSYNFLVQIKIKQKLIPGRNRKIQKYEWDRQLINQKENHQISRKLTIKAARREEEVDINQDWQILKQVILEAATEFKLYKDVKNANNWWDNECK